MKIWYTWLLLRSVADVTVKDLNIKGDAAGTARLRFAEKYALGVDATGSFSLTSLDPAAPIFTMNKEKVIAHSPQVEFKQLDAES